MRSGRLLPLDDSDRASAVYLLFAALNSLEPPLSISPKWISFIEDEPLKSKRRPDVVAAVRGTRRRPHPSGISLP